MTDPALRPISPQHPLRGDRARLDEISTKMWWEILKVLHQSRRPPPRPGPPNGPELTLVGGPSASDILQEAVLGLLRYQLKENETWATVNLAALGVRIAQNKAKQALRDSRAWRKRPGHDDIEIASLDFADEDGEPLAEQVDSGEDVELTIVQAEEELERLRRQAALHRAAGEVLSDRDRQIVFRISRGETRESIKDDFNISAPRVGQIYSAALIKLRNHLEADPLFRPSNTDPTEGGIPNGE